MHTDVDADPDLDIPEFDFDRARRIDPSEARTDEPVEIRIVGARSYSLRLIPSDKVVGRFASTLEAWPAILAELDRGIPARCLVLDAHLESGERYKIGSGRLLAAVARRNIGREARAAAS